MTWLVQLERAPLAGALSTSRSAISHSLPDPRTIPVGAHHKETNMLRALIAASLMTAMPVAALAHDFWLVAGDYQPAPGNSVDLDFVVGHGTDHEPWDLRWHRVVSLRSYLDGRVTDHQRDLRPLDAAPRPRRHGQASILVAGEGTHVIAFDSNHAFSELDPLAFDNYAVEEGLEHIIALREARGHRSKAGTELYARRAKTLIQSGDRLTDVTRPIGQTLEIVPLANPFEERRGGDIRFQILYRGVPLEGGLVRLRSLDVGSAAALRSIRSDKNGEVRLPVPKTGAWLVTVVWSSELEAHPAARFETIFASLTFGY